MRARVQESRRSGGGLTALAALVVAVPFVAWNGPSEAPSMTAAADTVRIEVTLKEFAFVPDTIRVPAGQPVTLVIKNVGLIPHEFMAGRNAEDGDFEEDLLADLHVNMVMGEMAMEEGGGHGHAAAGGHEEEAEEQGEHGGDAHGTMVTADAGKTVYMSFTLPETRRGVWGMGCFLPGHYQAGMSGTLIVE